MDAGTIATVLLAAIGLAGVGATVLRGVYKRGGKERHWTQALEDNTASNKELTVELRDFKAQTVEQIHGLDTRVAILEKAGGQQ